MKTHRCEGSLLAEASIRFNDDNLHLGKWILGVKTYDSEWASLYFVYTEINYCPFCGEKLE